MPLAAALASRDHGRNGIFESGRESTCVGKSDRASMSAQSPRSASEIQPDMEPSELADTIVAFSIIQNVTLSYALLKHEVEHPFVLEWILNKRGLSVLSALVWNAVYAVVVIWLGSLPIASGTWMRVVAIFYFTFPASVLIWTYEAERPGSD